MKPKRRSRRGTGISNTKLLVGGMAYGALRSKLSELVGGIGGPLGAVGDEVILGVGAMMLRRRSKGILRDITTAALAVESARLGESLTMGMLTGSRNKIPVIV
jgi:hypothetical protein